MRQGLTVLRSNKQNLLLSGAGRLSDVTVGMVGHSPSKEGHEEGTGSSEMGWDGGGWGGPAHLGRSCLRCSVWKHLRR